MEEMAPTVANDYELSELSTNELAKKLEQLGLATTGSKAVLRERLRRATEGESSKAREADNDGASKTDDADNIEALMRAQLVQKLRKLKLPVTETKAVLRERLKMATQKDDDSEEDEDEDDDDNAEEEETVAATHTGGIGSHVGNAGRHPRRVAQPSRDNREYHEYDRADGRRHVLSYKDIEDALTTFSSDGVQNVRKWLEMFEETADLCRRHNLRQAFVARFSETFRKL